MVQGSVPFACRSSQPRAVCRATPDVRGRNLGRGGVRAPGPEEDGGHRGGPYPCPSVPWGLPRPLTHGMLINQAANRWLGGTAPLRRPQDTAGSSAPGGRHGAAGESADLGGGEPGLLPAPSLQQAPVSAGQPLSRSRSSPLLLHPPLTPHPSSPAPSS